MKNGFFATMMLTFLIAGGALAQPGPEPVVQTEVKRAKTKDLKHPSLRFLRDNRVFLRDQLDRLNLLTTLSSDGEAELIDARLLRLQELAAAIAAARDTVETESGITARRELLDSVTRLGELEGQLVLMENLVADQRSRLQVLEDDFLGHQETALVILVRGLPGDEVPAGLILTQDNETIRVPLTDLQKSALAQGGVAQIYHRFVEPRDHVFTVTFEGAAWTEAVPVEVPVTAVRDKITFLELDLREIDAPSAEPDLMARVWQR